MRGRKPKPTHLKVLNGNPGKRPLNQDEPRPSGTAEPPSYLNGRGLELWRQYEPELTRIGVLTSADSQMFAVWCSLMAQFEEEPAEFPANRLAQLRALASSFGLDPSARSRMQVKPRGEEERDPWAELA